MATAIHQYEDKLLDFAYGELPAPEASAVESHVKSCARCTEALDHIRGVRTTMGALPTVAAPQAGLESLLAYAEQAAKRSASGVRAQQPWWKRMVGPLAAACALALVGVVAWRTQEEGLGISKEKVALDAKRAQGGEYAPAPSVQAEPIAPVAAAIPPELEKAAGKNAEARPSELRDREAKEDRNWDAPVPKSPPSKKSKMAFSNANAPGNTYQQDLGATKAPSEDQRQQLGEELAAAAKQSKTRRETTYENKQAAGNDDEFASAFGKEDAAKKGAKLEAPQKPAPAPPKVVADYANARGGYVADKKPAEKAGRMDDLVAATDSKKGKDSAPMGVSTGSVAHAEPQAPPPAQVAQATPAPQPSSLGLGLSTGGSGSGPRTPSAYKSEAAAEESAASSINGLAERKRLQADVEGERRAKEVNAKGYLDAARAAGNQGNLREEAKQAIAALQTGVTGYPRAEALQRACTALEELGEDGQADQFCDLLLREFPTTAAAKMVAQRRNQVQSAKPSRAISKKSAAPAFEADEQKAQESGQSPSKAKKAVDTAPAAAY